jgi:radical SAM protein with 4Fe4S-binding SPASM domain
VNPERCPFFLRELKIEVTHRCPLACIHCSSDASPSCSREMGEESCLRILREAITMGVKEVTFSGGEPLAWWPALLTAVTVAVGGNLRVLIYTSGNVPEPETKLRVLKSLGVEACIFSMFGATASVHELITRAHGSFKSTLEAVSKSTKLGLDTQVHFVPLSTNYRELGAVAQLAKDNGVSLVSVLRFVPQGRGRLLSKHALSRLQNLELKRTIERLRASGFDIRTGSPYNFLRVNEHPTCNCGIDRLLIGPDMKIHPCDAFKQIDAEDVVGTSELSSLDGASLRECWEGSPYLNAVREYLSTPPGKLCESCRIHSKCLSGCLAQKLVAYGNLAKRPDPMCLTC